MAERWEISLSKNKSKEYCNRLRWENRSIGMIRFLGRFLDFYSLKKAFLTGKSSLIFHGIKRLRQSPQKFFTKKRLTDLDIRKDSLSAKAVQLTTKYHRDRVLTGSESLNISAAIKLAN